MKIKLKDAHIEHLRLRNIFTQKQGRFEDGWLKAGDLLEVDEDVLIEPYTEFHKKPNFFSMGSFSFSRSSFPAGVTVGRYCVIADDVKLMAHAHPTTGLTFANIDYSSSHICFTKPLRDAGRPALNKRRWDNLPRADIEIGHSVWIGSGVLLKRNLKIGTGSLIASRSVVTKDVPPYTLVAGNPAVPKGRFDGLHVAPEVAERLLASRWWDYSFVDFHDFDTTDPVKFLDAFEKRRDRLKPWTPRAVRLAEELSQI